MSGDLAIRVEQSSDAVMAYDVACEALALAASADQVQAIRDKAERMKLYGKQAKNRDIIADAMAIVTRATRRLGEQLIVAREAGQISRGGNSFKDGSRRDGVFTLKEINVDKKLSMQAQKLAAFDAREFETVVEQAREKIKAGGAVVVNPAKDLSTRDKQLRRAIKLAQMAERQRDLPTRKYGVILADPEWTFEVRSEAGKDRSAENHYPTSSLEEIAARPVEGIAAADAVLGLWVPMWLLATGGHVPVVRHWGFEPKAIIVWDKVVPGTGYWVRNRVEALVICVRGSVPAPAPGTQWEDLVVSPKGVHSQKPDWAYELLEQMFPGLSKIELNARRRRAGWDAWGFEAPEEDVSPDDPADLAGGDLTPAAGQNEVSEVRHAPGAEQFQLRQDGPAAAAGAFGLGAPADAILAYSGPSEPEQALSANRVPPDEPAELAGGDALSLAGQSHSVAAGPETGAGVSVLLSGADGGGEGGGDSGMVQQTTLSEPLDDDQINAIIETAYATTPFPGIAAIMARTGLSRDGVKSRAKRRKLGDRARQVEVSLRPNADRAAPPAEAGA